MGYDFSNPETADAERARMQADYSVKTDEQGRQYTEMPGQPRNYIAPVASGAAAPEDDSGFFRSKPQWDTKLGKYVTPFDWGKMITIGTGAALTGGALSAAGAFGGAAGGAGGAASATGGLAPASSIPAATGAMTGIGLPTATAGATGAGNMGIWGTIAGLAKDYAGPVISAFGKSQADNRGAQVDIASRDEALNQGRAGLSLVNDRNAIDLSNLSRQQLDDYYKQMVAREAQGNASRTGAFKDLQHAEYVNSRGSQAPTVTTSGRTLNTMGLGARASTDAERAGATAMRNEVMTRLQGGNTLPTPEMPTAMTLPSAGKPQMWDSRYGTNPDLTSPSIWEQIANFAGPAATIYGRTRNSGKVSR